MSCHVMSCMLMSCLVLSCRLLLYLTLPYCLVLSCRVLSCRVLSCLVYLRVVRDRKDIRSLLMAARKNVNYKTKIDILVSSFCVAWRRVLSRKEGCKFIYYQLEWAQFTIVNPVQHRRADTMFMVAGVSGVDECGCKKTVAVVAKGGKPKQTCNRPREILRPKLWGEPIPSLWFKIEQNEKRKMKG